MRPPGKQTKDVNELPNSCGHSTGRPLELVWLRRRLRRAKLTSMSLERVSKSRSQTGGFDAHGPIASR